MKNSTIVFALLLLLASGFTSCKKSSQEEGPADGSDPEVKTEIPNSFKYSTVKPVSISLRLLANDNSPIKGAVVSISDPNDASRLFLKAVSDANGYIKSDITIPSYLDTLSINPNYVGLLNNAKAYVGSKGSLNAIIGGENTFSGDILPEVIKPVNIPVGKLLATGSSSGNASTNYIYPAPYTSSSEAVVSNSTYASALGRPKYLENTPDVIDAGLLKYVNASLPEGNSLVNTHPEYLTSTVTSNLIIKETSDVWITYVSEGAGYKNSLGFYSYKTASPPSSAEGIDKVTMVFPNASGYGSGGGLRSGDKVNLGRFEAGTTIAFVLLQDAWNGTGVNTSATKFYTDTKFNPEAKASEKKHSVLLYDNAHKLFLLGFEDINRSSGSGSDNDFNDLVIYATSNPVTGISNGGVSPVDDGGDTDGDGVIDELDAFPNDPAKAYITYYPSATGYATLAYEDFWPFKGDYDMNDLVVNYRYTFVKNAQNATVELTGEFLPVAAGASYKNGFGVQLPVSASRVASVKGQSLTGNYIQLAGNGVEAGQANAVIIPFDNHENLLKNADGSPQINTNPSKPTVTASKATVLVKFTSPVTATEIGSAPFNPFLISDRRRAYEVHLPGYAPTDKADKALLGTKDDNSTVSSSRYYLSKENAPWAISFTDVFNYPVEGKSIAEAYPHFLDWAKSNGTSYADWYVNTAVGYRVSSLIFKK